MEPSTLQLALCIPQILLLALLHSKPEKQSTDMRLLRDNTYIFQLCKGEREIVRSVRVFFFLVYFKKHAIIHFPSPSTVAI